jgi:hypothetical protein
METNNFDLVRHPLYPVRSADSLGLPLRTALLNGMPDSVILVPMSAARLSYPAPL